MKIPFEKKYREEYYKLLNQVFDSSFLSEGKMTERFEEIFGNYVKSKALALASGGAALLALLEYVNIKGKEVILPSNTFMADIRAVERAGGIPVLADCNKEDLCLSFEDLKKKITSKTKAVILVHIGGHLAFQVYEIAGYLRKKNIPLIEDCAHAHGALYKGKAGGTFGIGGAYSFYATKNLPLGEGGMLVSNNQDLIKWVKKFRNYGKFDYKVKQAFNFRINEVTAALGIIQMKRLPKILNWKRKLARKFDKIFTRRIYFPKEMQSSFYKYIIFDYLLKEETGKVFEDMCHLFVKGKWNLPNSEWVRNHHKCVPIYYGWDKADKSIEDLKMVLLK
ncbi:MAG: DegT/DnrJ/EryC1/StrS family aminotransferase [Armatimonadetes bacterium]|nr:DegT/DnrJ/EryC1/StrS family aminotransferase [Armatimonadota bacterium]